MKLFSEDIFVVWIGKANKFQRNCDCNCFPYCIHELSSHNHCIAKRVNNVDKKCRLQKTLRDEILLILVEIGYLSFYFPLDNFLL